MSMTKFPDRKRIGAIFLDRDGVINYERPGYVKSLREFRFIGGAVEGIKALSGTGMPVIVVTNQSAVGRGLLSRRTLNRIHVHMVSEARSRGGRIASVYYCPHRPEEGCTCRKPKIGMLLKARDSFGLDLKRSWFIGDKQSDERAAAKAGCTMVRIPSNTPFALLDASKKVARTLGSPREPTPVKRPRSNTRKS